MRTKFRICTWIPMTTLAITLFVWTIMFVLGFNFGSEGTPFIVVFLFTIFGLPIIALVGFFIMMWPMVTIDENGIRKELFGTFFKKSISWEELKSIRAMSTFGTLSMWVCFSKVDLTGLSISQARAKSEVYLFYSKDASDKKSQELRAAVKHFGGRDIDEESGLSVDS